MAATPYGSGSCIKHRWGQLPPQSTHFQKEYLEGDHTWTKELLQGPREQGDCLDNGFTHAELWAEVLCMSVHASVFCVCNLYVCMCTHV